MWIVYLLGLIIIESLADIYTKEHSLKQSNTTFVTAVVFYTIANVCFILSMRYNSKLAISANIFSVASGILAAGIGCFLYQEQLSTQNIIGIILGFISLILLIS